MFMPPNSTTISNKDANDRIHALNTLKENKHFRLFFSSFKLVYTSQFIVGTAEVPN